MDQLAREAQFTLRNRTLSGSLFFKTVLFDHLNHGNSSLEFHSSSIFSETGLKISKQGISNRFNEKAVSFWEEVISLYLSRKLKEVTLNSALKSKFKSVRIMDSTEFKLDPNLADEFPGYGGDGTKACAQIQFEFEMFSGAIKNLSLESSRVSDKASGSKDIDQLQANELLLRDLGYYNLNIYQKIDKKGAFFISRLNPQLNIYECKKGKFKQLTHKRIIQKLKKAGTKYLDIEVYLGKEVKLKTRLIANLLDKESVELRRKRLKKRKTNLSQSDHLSSQLNLFVTNIKEDIAPDQIYNLYKLRWQVELVFKAWKSVLKIHQFGKMSVHRLKCYLYAKLLWVMVSWDIYQCATRMIWNNSKKLPSLMKIYHQVKSQSYHLRKIMDAEKGCEKWLEKVFYLAQNFAIKEPKRGRIKVEEILVIN